MPISESGEFVRNRNVEKRESSVSEKLFAFYSGMKIQNHNPDAIHQPADVYYWKGQRLEDVKRGLETMATLAEENNISEIENPFNSEEKVDLADFVKKIEESIAYSERVAEQLQNQPSETAEESAKKRAAIKRRLLGDK